MAKPGDFHVGVLDIFAILLPGAIATKLLEPVLAPLVFHGFIQAPDGEAQRWGAFLVSSYFLGHLIFMLGAYIDGPYDRLRKRFGSPADNRAFDAASRIRERILDDGEQAAVNTFQWSRSVLIAVAPLAASDVHRIEADSKFFRSMLVVCLIAAIEFACLGQPAQAAIALALMAPCFARYFERRLKATRQAYHHVVALYRLGRLAAAPTHAEALPGHADEHAGEHAEERNEERDDEAGEDDDD